MHFYSIDKLDGRPQLCSVAVPCRWFFPIIGHMGICTSTGVIRDFAGPYFVSVSPRLPCPRGLQAHREGWPGPMMSWVLAFCPSPAFDPFPSLASRTGQEGSMARGILSYWFSPLSPSLGTKTWVGVRGKSGVRPSRNHISGPSEGGSHCWGKGRLIWFPWWGF